MRAALGLCRNALRPLTRFFRELVRYDYWPRAYDDGDVQAPLSLESP